MLTAAPFLLSYFHFGHFDTHTHTHKTIDSNLGMGKSDGISLAATSTFKKQATTTTATKKVRKNFNSINIYIYTYTYLPKKSLLSLAIDVNIWFTIYFLPHESQRFLLYSKRTRTNSHSETKKQQQRNVNGHIHSLAVAYSASIPFCSLPLSAGSFVRLCCCFARILLKQYKYLIA